MISWIVGFRNPKHTIHEITRNLTKQHEPILLLRFQWTASNLIRFLTAVTAAASFDQHSVINNQGQRNSKQCDEFFDGETYLPDDRAESAAIEFFVVGNGGLAARRLAHDNDVAPTLPIDSKATLA